MKEKLEVRDALDLHFLGKISKKEGKVKVIEEIIKILVADLPKKKKRKYRGKDALKHSVSCQLTDEEYLLLKLVREKLERDVSFVVPNACIMRSALIYFLENFEE